MSRAMRPSAKVLVSCVAEARHDAGRRILCQNDAPSRSAGDGRHCTNVHGIPTVGLKRKRPRVPVRSLDQRIASPAKLLQPVP
ncbi:hypothetical protein NY536_30705, partial [Enterobacter hormaechei]|nr:hypothetical protein [Enterobacter hormaechei]